MGVGLRQYNGSRRTVLWNYSLRLFHLEGQPVVVQSRSSIWFFNLESFWYNLLVFGIRICPFLGFWDIFLFKIKSYHWFWCNLTVEYHFSCIQHKSTFPSCSYCFPFNLLLLSVNSTTVKSENSRSFPLRLSQTLSFLFSIPFHLPSLSVSVCIGFQDRANLSLKSAVRVSSRVLTTRVCGARRQRTSVRIYRAPTWIRAHLDIPTVREQGQIYLRGLIGEIGSGEKFLCFPKSRNGRVKNEQKKWCRYKGFTSKKNPPPPMSLHPKGYEI